jgi:hypothetical protein
LGVEQLHRQGRPAPARQQVHEAAVGDVLLHRPARQQRCAQAQSCGLARGVEAVGGQHGPDGHAPAHAVVPLQLQLLAVKGGDRDPGQLGQRVGLVKRPAGHQLGRRHQHARHLCQRNGHHRTLGLAADADRAVQPLLDEVGRGVVQQPVHAQPGRVLQGPHQRRDEVFLAEGVRHLHAQQPLGPRGLGAQGLLEVLPLGGQRLGARQRPLAEVGQAQRVRGALDQRLAELLLQRLQPPADGGLGGAELAGRGRQAAGLDDADEGLHQLQAVGRGAHARSVWQSVGLCV